MNSFKISQSLVGFVHNRTIFKFFHLFICLVYTNIQIIPIQKTLFNIFFKLFFISCETIIHMICSCCSADFEQEKPLVETKGDSSNYYTTSNCSLGSNSVTISLHLFQKCWLLSTILLNSFKPKHLTCPSNICSSV